MIGWDDHPTKIEVRGQTIETFKRGALGKALNRTVTTIRSMEYAGVLCHPRLKDRAGRWLYTRDQIEDLIKLATEEGLMDPKKKKPFTGRFQLEAKRILSRVPAAN